MTTVHELAAHWLVRSLGWTLLHFCWQGALVAVLLWCGLQLLARRPAQERYLAACIALGLMVLLPLITFTQIGIREYRLAAEFQSSRLPDDPSLVLEAGLGYAASWAARVAAALDPALPWVLMAWVTGLVVSLVRLSVGLRLALRMKFVAVTPASASLQQLFAALKQRVGVLRPVALMNSALVQVPTVAGWLRPVVLLPVSCFTGLTEIQIEAILCHELAHIRRHDYLVSVVQSMVEAVLFYHPAVWWVSQQVRRERECCCDDLAVNVGGNALAYARALSTLEARRGSYPEVVLGSNGGVLTMRIKRLLQCEEVSAVPQMAAVVVLAILTVSAVAIAGTARAEARPSIKTASEAAPLNSQPAVTAAPAPSHMASSTFYKAAISARSAKPASAASAAPMAEGKTVADTPDAAQQPDQPIRVAGGILAGQLVSKTQPIYPADAKAAHVSGAVTLRALISKTGVVEQLQVVSGPPELRASALDAVRQWTYKPYLLNGEPVEVETTITVNYSFAGEPEPGPPNPNEGSDAVGMVPRKVGGSVSVPVLVSNALPEYTDDARAAKISGIVIVHFWVDEQGRPSHVQVARGLGHGLDEKAMEVVRSYQFKPAMEDGKPVVVALNAEIDFKMF